MPRRSVPSTCWAMACPMRSQYVESELTTLGRTVAASAPMLQTITRLGAGLNAFNANAAPIAMLSGARYLPDVPMEQLNPAMPEQTLAPAASRSDGHDRSKPTATLDRATPMHSQAKPRTEGSLPPPQQVSRREAVTTPQRGPDFDKTDGSSTNCLGDSAGNVIVGVGLSRRGRAPAPRQSNRHRAACTSSRTSVRATGYQIAGRTVIGVSDAGSFAMIDCSRYPRGGAIATVGSRRARRLPRRPS